MEAHGINLKGKLYFETVAVLPTWTSSDERRAVYCSADKKYYVGTNTAWAQVTTGATTYDFPTVSPSFMMNFSLGMDPQLIIDRACTATFVGKNGLIQTAANNVPRIDWLGGRPGYLAEDQRTNLFLYSEQFDNAAWNKLYATVTQNSTTAPDGTLTADTLTEDTATNQHTLYHATSISANLNTLSVFAKSGTANIVYLEHWNATDGATYAFFNTTTGVVGTIVPGTRTNVKTSMTYIGNGWYRCSLTSTSTVADNMYIGIAQTDGVLSYLGSNKTIYVWGAQCEVGGFPTSYIPTSASQVTRLQDRAYQQTSIPWFNTNEGTFFAEFTMGGWQTGTYPGVFGVYSSNNWEAFYLLFTGNGLYINARTNNVNTNLGFPPCTTGTIYKVAFSYIKGNATINMGLNGTIYTNAASSLVDTTQLSIFDIGTLNSASTRFNSKIHKFAYYPKSMSTAELTELTKG